MRHAIAVLAVGMILFTLTGCAVQYITPVRPPTGFFITNVEAPLSVNFSKTPVCDKRGSSSTYYFRDPIFTGLDFAWGEADLKSAAAAGNLATVEYADYEALTIFGIWGKFTVTAYGN
ncbi:MAG: hypothetical protein AMJ72_12365 [Acidithiobacillales bacterium SM1_46]|nr:MAG: hypothetical protein AMJ72_12365 [Acidithiobacillales bacterium SM1_46]